MKTLALLLALAPLLASAQATPAPTSRPAAPAAQAGQPDPARMERLQRRAQLALTLGLAEALQLDDAAALKVRGQIEKFTPRRMAAAQQMRDSVQLLRRSAQGEKVAAAADVDAAITRLLDARAQMQAVDREVVTTVTKDLPAEKRARAVLFLAKFHQRMMQELRPGGRGRGPGLGPGVGPGMGPGTCPCPGPGMGPGMGPGPHGPGGMGMGPGALGMNGPEGGWDAAAGDDEP